MKVQPGRATWVKRLLQVLVIEKIIQHFVVTLAFYFNWDKIGATVVVNPTVLMVLGGIVALLFIVSLWGMVTDQPWAMNLVVALALFDFLGEFIAQGRIDILITVSFLVAILILVLSFLYRRQLWT
jgi:hypothetical protein